MASGFESDFIFYEYSKLGVPMQTFFMLIPINNLDNGKHVLGVYETFKRDINIKLSDNLERMKQYPHHIS